MTASPEEQGPRRLRYSRSQRITRGTEIRELFRRGKRSKTAHLDVFDSASPSPLPRVGLVVPRHKQSAVARNQLKRRLREIARLDLLPRLETAGAPRDVLVRARREAYQASFAELRQELIDWTDGRWDRARRSE